MKLDSLCIDVGDLTRRDIERMHALFARHYDRADRRRFESDLSRKDWVIQLRHPATGRLCGFSTQALISATLAEGSVHALYSGDTIVDPRCWNETALIRRWGKLAVELIERVHPEPLFWFLIAKGYKTYRFLPVFFREFYPRYNCPTPPWAQEVVDALSAAMFGESYDSDRGLVIAPPEKDRLRPGVADVTARRLDDPHVRFFVQRNPNHAAGDELCCLAPLSIANFTPAGVRLLDPVQRPTATVRRRALSGTR